MAVQRMTASFMPHAPARPRVQADARVAAPATMRHGQTRSQPAGTLGFGCPPLTGWPHHVVVVIPSGRGGDIRIIENHGILGHSAQNEEVERCMVPRARWNIMADAAKAEFNARLREKGLSGSRWQPGENRVERILGTELLTLAWAAAAADAADVPAVVSTWVSLQPFERLWLAGRVLANPSDHTRRGLALLLSGGPVAADARAKAAAASSLATKRMTGPSLFDLR